MCIAIIVPEITPRLEYVADWIFRQQLGLQYELCKEQNREKDFSLVIHYGSPGLLVIPASGLLFERGIREQQIQMTEWNGIPALFGVVCSERSTLPFDLFAAVFFLLSRYEEYLPFIPDKHQRFPATESILFKSQLLDFPLVDAWVFSLGRLLESYGIKIQSNKFAFLPTYDIDIAWSYKHKGLMRTAGGFLNDLVHHKLSGLRERSLVLSGRRKDPYDSFGFTDQLHRVQGLKPLYFILAATENGPFDKHILPGCTSMKQLIEDLSKRYTIGVHPSYRSSQKQQLFAAEKRILEFITGLAIQISRQHYIRFSLPETYRALIQVGIQQDYSMGYGTHLGFRAGTSRSFFWYDLEAEQQSMLEVFPFSFMDTTAHYELKLSAAAAFEQLAQLKKQLQDVGGLLVTVFHNFSLGTDREWLGWADYYEQFCKEIN